jgi:hypothetical protein
MYKYNFVGMFLIFGATSASATELPATWAQTHETLPGRPISHRVARLVGTPFSYILLSQSFADAVPMVDLAIEEDPISSCHWVDRSTSVATKTGLDAFPTYMLQENPCERSKVRLLISYSGTQKTVFLKKTNVQDMSPLNVGVIGH